MKTISSEVRSEKEWQSSFIQHRLCYHFLSIYLSLYLTLSISTRAYTHSNTHAHCLTLVLSFLLANVWVWTWQHMSCLSKGIGGPFALLEQQLSLHRYYYYECKPTHCFAVLHLIRHLDT